MAAELTPAPARPRPRPRLLVGGFHPRTLVEWLLLTSLVIALAVLQGKSDSTLRVDRAVYDLGIVAQQHAPRDDILIVSIDDESLAAVGRWPWRRAVLAEIVDRIAAGDARVIGLDVLLVDSDSRHPEDDRALGASIRRAGNVVLPALAEPVGDGYRLRYPLRGFDADAGHINISVDNDGIARHVYLREGTAGEMIDHFAVRLVDFGRASRPLQAFRQDDVTEVGPKGWLRRYRLSIPFVGPPGSFTTVSAVDVLTGKVGPDTFRGKTVLVGAGATGMGDNFSAPLASHGTGLSGVELLANATQALMDDTGIVAMPRAGFWLMTVMPVVLGCLAALLLSPRGGLLFNIALCAALLFGSVLLMHYARVWFSPIPAVLACLVFYPLWSWRRQESALAFLSAEVARLEAEPTLPGGAPMHGDASGTLDTRMSALYRMITRLRNLRRFLSDGLESLPDATLICDPEGRLLVANAGAHALAPRALASQSIPGGGEVALESVMAEVFSRPQQALDYWERLCAAARRGDGDELAGQRVGVELQAADQRAILLRGAPLHGDGGQLAGFSVSFVDITQVRIAERQREETLRFISHDMRSPQASILALVELQRDPQRALAPDMLLERIRHHAGRTLALADDFIQLARAETQHLRFVETDLATVLMDAADSLWSLAHARHVTVRLDIAAEEMVVQAEGNLLGRAVGNLIDNAIKYSPDGSTVTVRAGRTLWGGVPDAGLMIAVSDEGAGIAPEEQARLFQPFSRLQGEGRPVREGSGLGLMFVRTVVERHGGRVRVHSAPGSGATFTIELPA
ncbi:hypothetical protein L602_002700000100 [Cupriavidus gilardii J11]|uniref:histidine kinase n=1 Tax=Cupriavidus gilardii J11 TaxID=936133 RepID=A0A562BI98_9BURK|nr:CHASE2 domain-containing protein [Cupriavidus gilardii]TWG84918.1 hypothetical protein L602_002700000100 [Cupriavidus gilardii J11]